MREFVHLSKIEKTLFSGSEWTVKAPVWLVLQLTQGVAYLRGGQASQELRIGAAAVIPPNSPVTVLASVLCEANLRGCAVHMDSLSGLVTSAERLCLEKEAAVECAPYRQIAPSDQLAGRLGHYLQNGGTQNLAGRLGFVHAFAEWLGPFLTKSTIDRGETLDPNPKVKLKRFLNQVPESELTELSLGDVARHLCCCERHASRLFHEVCGSSFREYLSELRLKKACQMLVQGDHKIIDVALESGHSSLALFNCNFKSRFRMTPTEWRVRHGAGLQAVMA